MGTLTYAELEEEVRSALGGRTDLDSRLTRFLNLGQTRIARLSRWEELEQITTGTLPFTADPDADKFLTLDSDIRDVYTVRILDGTESIKLSRRTFRQFDRLVPNPGALTRRKPQIYVVWAGKIEFFPVQDKAYDYEIRSVKWPTAFDGTANQKSDLDNKDDLIIAATMIYIYRAQQDFEQAEKWTGILRELYREAKTEESEMPDLDPLPGPGVAAHGVPEYHKDPFAKRMP